ncbi:MAG: SRPBCC family protein [Pseudomonadota bacterium]|nr:SRPBCC family protein [Pseudomonadota bacterium]
MPSTKNENHDSKALNISPSPMALSAEQYAKIHRSIEHASGLPSMCYTSGEWARVERDTLLASSWTCIGYCHDLQTGGVRTVDLLGLPLMIVRDEAGAVRVFHNVCRHRGHRLAINDCVVGKVLRCPYHSWTYDLDGSLRNTPHIGGHGQHTCAGFDKSDYALWSVRSATWLGMVFVNLAGDAPDFRDHIAALEERWSTFTGRGALADAIPATQGGALELNIKANWKLAVENYCESYHLPWIHPGLNSYSRIDDHYNIVGDGWGAGQGTSRFVFSERIGIELPGFSRWPQDKRAHAEYVAVFPNVLLGLHVDHFYSAIVLPVRHDQTKETLQIYYLDDGATADRYSQARQLMLEGWREVFSEDIAPVEAMQRGRDSTAFDGGRFSPVLDVPTHHFHRWVARGCPAEGAIRS